MLRNVFLACVTCVGLCLIGTTTLRAASPNDTYWSIDQKQYMGGDLGSGWTIRLRLPAAWDLYTGDPSLIIGALEVGPDHFHEDFLGRAFIGDGHAIHYHGTAIASIIMAMTNNDMGVAGVVWDGVYGNYAPAETDVSFADAYWRAVNDGCKVVNTSAYIPNTTFYSYPYEDTKKPLYSLLAHRVWGAGYEAGVVNICAGGRYFPDDAIPYPGGFPVITIAFAGIRSDGNWIGGSDGAWIDFAAPAEKIATIKEGGGYNLGEDGFGGSSSASAFGSGLAGLLCGYATGLGYDLDTDDVRALFRLRARKTTGVTEEWNAQTGYGVPDVAASQSLISHPNSLKRFETSGGWTETVSAWEDGEMYDIPGVSNVEGLIRRHKFEQWIPIPGDYFQIDGIWANGRNSMGAQYTNTLLPIHSGDVTFWSAEGCSLTTYGYEIKYVNFQDAGTWPTVDPAEVSVAYTILGEVRLPVTNAYATYDTSLEMIRVYCPNSAENEDSYNFDLKIADDAWQEDFSVLPANTTQFNHTNLQGSQTYSFRVHPENINQAAPTGATATITTRPNKPEGVQASLIERFPSGSSTQGKGGGNAVDAAGEDPGDPIYATDVRVFWQQPLNQAQAPDHYQIEAWRVGEWHTVEPCWATGCCPCKLVEVFSDIQALTETVCLDLRDQEYEIVVYAVGADGQASRVSNAVQITTGSWDYCNPPLDPPVAIKSATPREFSLAQNYPNPFNPTTMIEFSVPTDELVVLDVYNILGQQVQRLVEEYLPAGLHTAYWEGKDSHGRAVPSGMYIYRMTAGQRTVSRKMVLLR